jgi:hypothetical protein
MKNISIIESGQSIFAKVTFSSAKNENGKNVGRKLASLFFKKIGFLCCWVRQCVLQGKFKCRKF